MPNKIISDLLFNCQSNSQLNYLEVPFKKKVFYTYTSNIAPSLSGDVARKWRLSLSPLRLSKTVAIRTDGLVDLGPETDMFLKAFAVLLHGHIIRLSSGQCALQPNYH